MLNNKGIQIMLLFHVLFVFVHFSYSQNPELVIQRGHLAPVKKICFHENNKFLASSDERNYIIIWDFMLGKEIARFKDSSEIVAMDFLASRDVLITANTSGQIKYYNIETTTIDYIIPFEKEIKKIIHFNNEVILVGDGLHLISFEREEINFLSPLNFEDLKFDYQKFLFIGQTSNQEVLELDTLFQITKRGFLSSVSYGQKKDIFDPSNKVRSKPIELNSEDQSFFYCQDGRMVNSYLFNGENIQKKALKLIPNTIAVDESGNYVAFGDDEGRVNLFIPKSKQLIDSKVHMGKINDIEFSVNGRYFATASEDFSVIVWSSIDGQLIHDLKSHALPVYGLDFYEKEQKLFIAQDQGVATVIDLKNKIDLPGKYNHRDHVGVVSDIKFSKDKYFTSGFDNNLIAYDLKTQKLLYQSENEKYKSKIENTLQYGDQFIYSIQPSIEGEKLLVLYGEANEKVDVIPKMKVVSSASLNKSVLEKNTVNFDIPEEFKYDGSNYYYIPKFNHETWGTKNYVGWLGSKNVLLSSENSFCIFEMKKSELEPQSAIVELLDEVTAVCKPNSYQFFFSMGKMLYSMKDFKEENIREINSHQDIITDVIASSQFIFSSSLDGSIKIWNLQIEELIATVVPFADNSMLIFTPDNYYLSINGAHQYVGYKIGSKFIPFENYDLKYNRPDIVLSRLGLSDQTTIDLLKKSYEKRLRKFGFKQEQINSTFYIPEVEIKNLREIPLLIDEASVHLNMSVSDAHEPIDRLNIWVNGVPYFGMNGLSFKNENTKNISKNLEVFLVKGKNVIEVSAINKSGGESLKKKLEIYSNQEELEKSLYLITIGVQEFENADFNLNYSVKDATNIHDHFAQSGFSTIHDFELINEKFNLQNLQNLKQQLKGSKPQDQVVLFIATHGLIDADFEYYFATSTTDFNNPKNGGIPKSVLDNLLDSIPARNKLVLFDACHSGEIDKGDLSLTESTVEKTDITFRSAGKSIKYNNVSAQKVSELEELLFEDFRKGNGSTILTSSSGIELSMESKEWNNGLFTFALKNALSNSTGKEQDLIKLFQIVFETVQKLSKGKQTPTIRAFNKNSQYIFK